MAGDWIAVESVTPDKPEVHEIAALLGIEPETALGHLIRFWIWADQQTLDGNAARVSLSAIDSVSRRTGLAQAMVDVGWLKRSEGGVSLPNFDRLNGETAKKRALTRKRVKRFRNAQSNDDGVTSALPEKRRSKSIVSSLRSETVNEGSENFLPENPTPSPRTPGRPHRTEAEKLLAFLNEKTGKGFRPVDSNLRLIEARLASGVSPLRVKQVILRKWREWKDRDDMAMYLRPDTLFNATKFEQYLGEIPPERAPIHDLMEDDHAEEARP